MHSSPEDNKESVKQELDFKSNLVTNMMSPEEKVREQKIGYGN